MAISNIHNQSDSLYYVIYKQSLHPKYSLRELAKLFSIFIYNTPRACIFVQVTIYRRFRIGREGHLDPMRSLRYIVTCTIIRAQISCEKVIQPIVCYPGGRYFVVSIIIAHLDQSQRTRLSCVCHQVAVSVCGNETCIQGVARKWSKGGGG